VGPEHTFDFVGLAGQTYRVDVIQRVGDACEVTGWAWARVTLKGDADGPAPDRAPVALAMRLCARELVVSPRLSPLTKRRACHAASSHGIGARGVAGARAGRG